MDALAFPVLSQKMQKKVISTFHPRIREFKKNELILEKASSETRLCLLLKGTAYLCIENEHGIKQLLDFFTRGAFFSYRMMPAAPGCHCFIHAKYPCSVAYLPATELLEYIVQNPADELGSFLQNSFYHISSSRNEHCHMLQQKSIRDKLLAFFQYLSALNHTTTLQMPIPYSDLADYLTIDRSALMTELTRMQSDGLIQKDFHTIALLIKSSPAGSSHLSDTAYS